MNVKLSALILLACINNVYAQDSKKLTPPGVWPPPIFAKFTKWRTPQMDVFRMNVINTATQTMNVCYSPWSTDEQKKETLKKFSEFTGREEQCQYVEQYLKYSP